MLWRDLERYVNEAGGLRRTPMRMLRELVGARRTDSPEIQDIPRELERHGFGYFTPDGSLPKRQDDDVLVFKSTLFSAELIRIFQEGLDGRNAMDTVEVFMRFTEAAAEVGHTEITSGIEEVREAADGRRRRHRRT
jgi:hypothetical protein